MAEYHEYTVTLTLRLPAANAAEAACEAAQRLGQYETPLIYEVRQVVTDGLGREVTTGRSFWKATAYTATEEG